MRFDLTDLRLFRHVVETESITRGAERTHLALASASARIRGMEEVLGVPLLKRGRRGVQPTDAGRALLDHARIVLQQIETMRGELGAYSRGLKGHVRVLANTAALSEHLPGLLATFLAANPTIDLDLEDRESPAIAAAIAAGDADIGIATEAALVPGLESHPFRPDRLVLAVAAGHPLARRRQVAFAQLLDLDFVGLTRGTALDEHVARHAARLGRPLRMRVRANSLDAVCAMAAAGVGVGIVPEATARRQRRALPLVALRIAEPWAMRQLTLCVRDQRHLSRPARRLFETLRQAA
ncbi:MAG: LysR family transcriptional regulator [Reyranella sp.]|jgi:DNA-binding transcriptional LysR family regulator|uniref:LysR family transcriptional regulator n=1 Tax=Reyranella sp. TaxID=1929291 RepID=UPI00095AAE55|nr:LysR family transcriptional regulator [Reyranella sp.]MBN9535200.1 LysR family transcriptional regulator [Alphaproteobacteria bacterium]MBR2819316.1 LysR family transcriptional regulator [Reyranella sp.]OJU44396.1 MAG: LysR family transcriptional regulator [Alphaproteobacteria bacterium 65-37]